MKKLIFGFTMILTLLATAQEKQIESFPMAKEKATLENKKILLYFSGSDWCAPCIKFKKTYIDTPEFKTFSNEKLIVFNVDFPRLRKNKLTEDKIKSNEWLAEQYNKAGHFPLVLLLDTNGIVLKKWDGIPTETVQELIKILR